MGEGVIVKSARRAAAVVAILGSAVVTCRSKPTQLSTTQLSTTQPSGTRTVPSRGADPTRFRSQPLVRDIYTADPSAHVFDARLYIYPSHDRESGIPEDNLGSHFDMRDYHVFSMDQVPGKVVDHGVALDIDAVPWAEKQLWAPDAAATAGRYLLYFPAKDSKGIFRIGVATSTSPVGPFEAQPRPVEGSFSIDPAVFKDEDGTHYMYFGGIWGGQLQRFATGVYRDQDIYPAPDQPALMPKVARLNDELLAFAEPPKDVPIVDENGKPLTAGDNGRRFFEASWVHKRRGVYYFSYSTGDTHNIVYATGSSPYGPFKYRGVLLKLVLGWTNHHSVVQFKGKWHLFYHDTQLSGGRTHLRNIKLAPLVHREDGSIETVDPFAE